MKKHAQQLQQVLSGYSSILIVIKGSPDPDALASSFALKVLCDFMNIDSMISATTRLSLPQNKALVSQLKIPIHFSKKVPEADRFDAYIVPDHQSPEVTGLTGRIPCAAHIDHHEKLPEDITCGYRIVEEQVGSTSTIMALLFKEICPDIEPSLMKDIATALIYGIQTDTDKYRHAEHLDYKAINFLSKFSDDKIINKITGLPMSEKTALLLAAAVQNQIIYKDWLITGVGFIEENTRDSIAIIADFLLARQQLKMVIVYAVIEGGAKNRYRLDASLRTSDEEMPLNDIIQSISSTGGARRFKGAYQVDLDYFSHTPDREKLWHLVAETTLETVKHQRDTYTAQRIKGAFSRLFRVLKGRS